MPDFSDLLSLRFCLLNAVLSITSKSEETQPIATVVFIKNKNICYQGWSYHGDWRYEQELHTEPAQPLPPGKATLNAGDHWPPDEEHTNDTHQEGVCLQLNILWGCLKILLSKTFIAAIHSCQKSNVNVVALLSSKILLTIACFW